MIKLFRDDLKVVEGQVVSVSRSAIIIEDLTGNVEFRMGGAPKYTEPGDQVTAIVSGGAIALLSNPSRKIEKFVEHTLYGNGIQAVICTVLTLTLAVVVVGILGAANHSIRIACLGWIAANGIALNVVEPRLTYWQHSELARKYPFVLGPSLRR